MISGLSPKVTAIVVCLLVSCNVPGSWYGVEGTQIVQADIGRRVHQEVDSVAGVDQKDSESEESEEYLEDFMRDLKFHSRSGSNAVVSENGKTVYTNNEDDEDGFSGVLTQRPLRYDEMFEIVHQDRSNDTSKHLYTFDVGVTDFSPDELNATFPRFMDEIEVGHWLPNWTLPFDLKANEFVGLMKRRNGELHAFLNGVHLGAVATGVPDKVYGYVEIYSNDEVQISIVDQYACPATEDPNALTTSLFRGANQLNCLHTLLKDDPSASRRTD